MATKVRVNRGDNSKLPLGASGMLVHVSEENFMNQMAYHGTANGGTNEIWAQSESINPPYPVRSCC